MGNIFTDLGFDVLLKGNNAMRLLEGLLVALKISMISVLISLPAGGLLGVFMSLDRKGIRFFGKLYLEVIRIMPQMVLLFIVYFGAAKAFGLKLSPELSSVIVFLLWGAAEMSDLVRGAVQSIPRAQYESSAALGMSTFQTYRYVIVPQIVRRILPNTINLITMMIKTTSLVMMIGIVEVLKVGQQIIEANRKNSPNAAFGVFATVFLLYFLACYPISLLSRYLEKKAAA